MNTPLVTFGSGEIAQLARYHLSRRGNRHVLHLRLHGDRVEELSPRLLRLPMYSDLTDREVEEVASIVLAFYLTRHTRRCIAHDI
jgi:hypothetical protein